MGEREGRNREKAGGTGSGMTTLEAGLGGYRGGGDCLGAWIVVVDGQAEKGA